jgi:hypothetical protein
LPGFSSGRRAARIVAWLNLDQASMAPAMRRSMLVRTGAGNTISPSSSLLARA